MRTKMFHLDATNVHVDMFVYIYNLLHRGICHMVRLIHNMLV